MMSPRFAKAGITQGIVENPWEYRTEDSVPRKSGLEVEAAGLVQVTCLSARSSAVAVTSRRPPWCLAEASANSRTAPGHFHNFATPETRMRRITYLSAAYVVIHLFDIFVQAIMGTTSASPPMELARVAPIRLRLRTLDPKATSHIHGMYAVIRLLVQNIRSVKQRIVISNMRTPQ